MSKIPFRVMEVLRREEFVWGVGLLSLALIDPTNEQHWTLCPIKFLGWDWCPGCGLGRSISFLFRGDVQSSFEAHPLGIIALLILLVRIIQLLRFRYATFVNHQALTHERISNG